MNKTLVRSIPILVILLALLLPASPRSPLQAESLWPDSRPGPNRFCFDRAKVLPEKTADSINNHGRGLKKAFDIDFVVVTLKSLGNSSIDMAAADILSKWKIGESTQGRKGMLILVAWKEQQVRIEVGYDLEHIYTDRYVADIQRGMLKEFLEQAEWDVGFAATIESFVGRAFEMAKKGSDVRSVESKLDADYYSGGAGARNVFDWGAALNKPLPKLPKELKAYFGAQATPESTVKRYLEFCARNIRDYNVELFSDLSREFFSNWKTASGQRQGEARTHSGKPFVIYEGEPYAVAVFPNSDLDTMRRYAIYLMIKSEKGWQMDINTMTRVLQIGRGIRTHMVGCCHPYLGLLMSGYTFDQNQMISPKGSRDGFLGFYQLAKGYYPDDEPGMHIDVANAYEDRSPLKFADSVVEINGQKVTDSKSFYRLIKGIKIDDKLQLKILRKGKPMKVEVTAFPPPDPYRAFRKALETPRPWLGLYFAMTMPYERKWADSYCAITHVHPRSPAARAGIRAGDIITGIDGENGRISAWSMWNFVSELEANQKVRLEITRQGESPRTVVLRAEETSVKGYF